MRLSEIRNSPDGRCIRIAYLGSKGDIVPNIEHFSAGICGRRKRIHIASLGVDATFAQARKIAETILQIVKENE